MRYPTFAMVTAMGLLLGCRDSTVGIGPSPAEDSPARADTAPDVTAVRDLLDDPLVHELLAELADQTVAQMTSEVITALAAPRTTIRITTIQAALARLQERLAPQQGDKEGELPRAVLGIIVADAAAVLATL